MTIRELREHIEQNGLQIKTKEGNIKVRNVQLTFQVITDDMNVIFIPEKDLSTNDYRNLRTMEVYEIKCQSSTCG